MKVEKAVLVNIGDDLGPKLQDELQNLGIHVAKYRYQTNKRLNSTEQGLKSLQYDIVILDCQNHRSILRIHPMGVLGLIDDLKKLGKYVLILTEEFNIVNEYNIAQKRYNSLRGFFRKAAPSAFVNRDCKTIIDTLNNLRKDVIPKPL